MSSRGSAPRGDLLTAVPRSWCSGIAPGFTGDAFVLTTASLCARVTSVAVNERIFMGSYTDPLSFQFLGFGRPPEELVDDARPTKASDAFSSTFSMIADGLGCRFDEVWNHREYAVDHPRANRTST